MKAYVRPNAALAMGLVALVLSACGEGIDAHFEADFFNPRGNNWWVETNVSANAPLEGVDARVDGGPWQPLSPTDWGSWADSFFVPSGSLVQFRAHASAEDVVLSGTYLWPDAVLVDGPPEEPQPPSDPGDFEAGFVNARGNTWWVEVEVSANAPVTAVHASVNDGPWQPLEATGWGSWADSFFVSSGSLVRFRATATGGGTAQSGHYVWPDAVLVDDPLDPPGEPSPPDDPPPPDDPADFVTHFFGVRGNAWWVEVEVSANAPVVAVHASVNDGPWQALSPTGWGSWAESFFVSSGSLVRFHAASGTGATGSSGLYQWPDAILVDDDPGDPPPPPSGEALPDLILAHARTANTLSIGWEFFPENACAFAEGCLQGTGWRRLLRFATEIQNAGDADLHLGDPRHQTDLFEYDACHGHYHLLASMAYRLLDGAGNDMVPGYKQSFCWGDVERVPHLDGPTTPNYPMTDHVCNENQGLTRGWADIYFSDLDCQFLDITDVPPGIYTLRATVNDNALLEESDYSNNTIEVVVEIPADG
jgi:hypothetical protein